MSLEQALVVKNPRENPTPWGWLLVLGGIAAATFLITRQARAATKRDNTPRLYAIGPDCQFTGISGEDAERQGIVWVTNGLRDVGGSSRMVDGEVQLNFEPVLGQPPGPSAQQSNDFAQAWATAIFKRGMHPQCRESMGIPDDFARETNQYGPDYSEWEGPWPGDTATYFQNLILATHTVMATYGYDADGSYFPNPGSRLHRTAIGH